MSLGRSNSSAQLRKSLREHYVKVPDVLPSLQITLYTKFAQNLLIEANTYFGKNQWENAYVCAYKFVQFVTEKLPRSEGYKLKSYQTIIADLKRNAKEALDKLELIAAKLDDAEDMRLKEQEDADLMEFFDVDDDIQCTTLSGSDLRNTGIDVCQPAALPLAPPVSNTDHASNVDLNAAFKLLKSSIQEPETSFLTPPPATSSTLTLTEFSVPEFDYTTSFDAATVTPRSLAERSCGASGHDLEILRHLHDCVDRFHIPPPQQTRLDLQLGRRMISFVRDDFHVSYAPFIFQLPGELQLSRSACETNRCFFLHLGVAMNIHPLVLQFVFRGLAQQRVAAAGPDDISTELLASVMQYAGFVDANALCFLWPREFNATRICIISGSPARPMFSCFSVKTAAVDMLRDVIIHCDGQHFTLLRPMVASTGFSILPDLLGTARSEGLIVQVNELETPARQSSVEEVVQELLGS